MLYEQRCMDRGLSFMVKQKTSLYATLLHVPVGKCCINSVVWTVLYEHGETLNLTSCLAVGKCCMNSVVWTEVCRSWSNEKPRFMQHCRTCLSVSVVWTVLYDHGETLHLTSFLPVGTCCMNSVVWTECCMTRGLSFMFEQQTSLHANCRQAQQCCINRGMNRGLSLVVRKVFQLGKRSHGPWKTS